MLNIAIDGPSGAGKSSVAKAIASKLNITYLDTGAMYRAIAHKMYLSGIDCNDADSVIKQLDNIELVIEYDNGLQKIILDGIDISQNIREHFMSKMASDVSRIPEVRNKLVNMQRDIANKKDVVLDGRDITSYVLPDAEYKFFLTATPEERAQRRYNELIEKGQNVIYEEILKDIIDRDYNDSNRKFAPLIKTDDSILIDSTNMSLNDTIDKIISYIK